MFNKPKLSDYTNDLCKECKRLKEYCVCGGFTSSPLGSTAYQNYGIPFNDYGQSIRQKSMKYPGTIDLVHLIMKAYDSGMLIGFRDCQTTFTPKGLARKLCTNSASLDVSLYTIVPPYYQNVALNCHIGDDGKFTNPSKEKVFTRKIVSHSFPNGSPNPFRKWITP